MLKIKNPKSIIGMTFRVGEYTLEEAEEHNDRYTFSFQDKYKNWAIIHLSRNPIWDKEKSVNMYRIDNGTGRIHSISADWFSEIANVQWTFETSLKELH